MRPRDVRVPPFDMASAAEAIASFVDGRTVEEYESDLMLRSAVDFRNVIAHEYDRLSDRTVWDIATGHLPVLRESLAVLLEERG
jgi:uncharacterized protein with HEPN domain